MSGPRVTVGIPVFNAERFLPTTLAAVRAQTFADLEIVISDNASVDGTRELCLAAARDDARIRYVRAERNNGLDWNFNRTLELASAPLFMWNPADDVALPRYVETCVATLDAAPELGVATTLVQDIDEHGRLQEVLPSLGSDGLAPRASSRVRTFLRNETWDLVYAMTRTPLLRSVGGLQNMVGEDILVGVDLLLRSRVGVVEEPLFQRRRHASQSSLQPGADAGTVERDPDSSPWVAFPHWRINAELYRHAATSQLSMGERVAVGREILTGWTVPKARRLVGDLRRSAALARRRLEAARSPVPR